MKKYLKIIFWIGWLLIILIGPLTIIQNTDLSKTFSSYGLYLNFFERVSGVTLLTLLGTQIILGSFRDKFDRFHKILGGLILILILIHPLFLFIFNYKLYHTIDPFYIYSQACLLCKTPTELFLSFGRLAIWGALVSVVFKKVHIVNYLVFILVALHGYLLGSDFRLFPLNIIFWLLVMLVLLSYFNFLDVAGSIIKCYFKGKKLGFGKGK